MISGSPRPTRANLTDTYCHAPPIRRMVRAVVVVAERARRRKTPRDVLLGDAQALAELSRRGLARVCVRQLSRTAGLSRPTVERWLRGDPVSPPTDEKLRKVCGLSSRAD